VQIHSAFQLLNQGQDSSETRSTVRIWQRQNGTLDRFSRVFSRKHERPAKHICGFHACFFLILKEPLSVYPPLAERATVSVGEGDGVGNASIARRSYTAYRWVTFLQYG
jgi:hypothetical protein